MMHHTFLFIRCQMGWGCSQEYIFGHILAIFVPGKNDGQRVFLKD